MGSSRRSSKRSASAIPGPVGEVQGKNPVYYVLGETEEGRRLFCVVISFPDGKGYPITVREMTEGEKRRHAGWKEK